MVNEERTKRYSWGVEATTSLFLEGGLLAACNVLYGYHLSEVFTVGLGFGLNTPVGDLLPGTDFFARLEAELPAGKVAPYLSFDIGGMYSPWSGMPFSLLLIPVWGSLSGSGMPTASISVWDINICGGISIPTGSIRIT